MTAIINRDAPIEVTGTVAVTGGATAANQTTEIAALGSLLTELQQKTEPADTQPISAVALPLPSGAATENTLTAVSDNVEAVNNTLGTLILFPGDDASSSGGPLVQGVVSDRPSSFQDGEVRPVSLTSEGRVRVSMVPADVDRVWQHTFDAAFTFDWPDLQFAGTAYFG